MTTYERWKVGFLAVSVLCLISVSVAFWQLKTSWDATPGKVNSAIVTAQATMDTLSTVGPQATKTLKSLEPVGKQATATLKQVGAQANRLGGVLDSTTETLGVINRDCPGGLNPAKSCGTLADLNRTLATVRGTFGQIEVAARHENRQLGTLDAQELQLYTDTHVAVTNLNGLLTSPDVTRFLKASADTSIQVSGIAADIHKESTALTAPKPWYKQLYTYGNTGVNVACLVTHSCPF